MVFAAPLILLATGFVATGVLVLLVLQVAHRRDLYAHPNARSSHVAPTPSIGGVGLVIPLLTLLTWLWLAQDAPVAELLIAFTLLAAAGLWDDLTDAPALIRFGLQIIAVAIACVGLPQLAGWQLALVAGLTLWHVNLFNFMDGIDGYAGSQILLFALGSHLLMGGGVGWSGAVLGLLAGCAIGFLVYNWAPAKVFMGDVGSVPIGLLIAMLVAHLWASDQLPLIASLILLAGFWFDATYTLCVRIVTGQPFTQAHRSHLYQYLARAHGHAATSGWFWLFGTLWLLPLAWMSIQLSAYALLFLALAVVPLLVGCLRVGAGRPGE